MKNITKSNYYKRTPINLQDNKTKRYFIKFYSTMRLYEYIGKGICILIENRSKINVYL